MRVPLIVAAPGFKGGQVTKQPAGLIDIYPTLLDLAGLPAKSDLEGRSLKSALESPDARSDRAILCVFAPENYSLRSTDYHYIQYGDGSEELYDMKADPHEFANLAAGEKYEALLTRFRSRLPKTAAKPIRSKWKRWEIEAWETAEKNAAAR